MSPEAATLVLWLLTLDEPFVTPRGLAEALLGGALVPPDAAPWEPAPWGSLPAPPWQLATRFDAAGGPDGPFPSPPYVYAPSGWCVE